MYGFKFKINRFLIFDVNSTKYFAQPNLVRKILGKVKMHTVLLAILACMNTEVVFRLLFKFCVSSIQGDK